MYDYPCVKGHFCPFRVQNNNDDMDDNFKYLEPNRFAILANETKIQQLKTAVEQLEIIRNKDRIFFRRK